MDDITTWIPLILLALAALLPLTIAVLRPRAARGRREADMALYRAQLAELDREREAGRLDEAGLRAARLEVQRRLIAAADQAEGGEAQSQASPVLLALLPLMVAGGLGLYLMRGSPGMPSATYAERVEAQRRDDRIIAALRQRLAAMDPQTPQAWQGYVLLGNAERARGRADAAAEAWHKALGARFDPRLAADLAELEIDRGKAAEAVPLIERALREAPQEPRLRYLSGLAALEGGHPEVARGTWQALMADTPADAPWRAMLERRLSNLP